MKIVDEETKSDVVAERWRVSAVKNKVHVSGVKVDATEIYADGSAEWLAQVLRPERAAQIVAEHSELEQLRSLNQTQAESIVEFQSQLRVMKQAITNAINVLSMDFPGSIKRKDAIDRLRSAITPKGSEQ